jgi:hypothetical protein
MGGLGRFVLGILAGLEIDRRKPPNSLSLSQQVQNLPPKIPSHPAEIEAFRQIEEITESQ